MTKVRLGSESFAIVARKGHPLFRGGMTLEAWLATDQIVVSAAGDLHGAIDPVLAARGLTRRTRAADPAISGGVRDGCGGRGDGERPRIARQNLRRAVRPRRLSPAARPAALRTDDPAGARRGAGPGAGLAGPGDRGDSGGSGGLRGRARPRDDGTALGFKPLRACRRRRGPFCRAGEAAGRRGWESARAAAGSSPSSTPSCR